MAGRGGPPTLRPADTDQPMQDHNPYAYAPVAAEAPVAERAAFLQKTYSLLLLGIFGFAFTLWAAGNIQPVNEFATRIWRASPWIPLIGVIAGSWLVHANARRFPLNLILYFDTCSCSGS